jgi:NADH-quinone oxidoreductase subunit M
LVGVFVALDGLLFYIFWELALIPIYIICGIWGGENRIKITLKFFIYTFAGSLLMLLGILYLYLQTNTPHSFSYEALQAVALTPQAANYIIWAFFIAFAIKMPVFPFHTWQPSTYTTAPAQGTMLLSGIMLKMGIYGTIRWLLPLAPEALAQNLPIFMALCIIGIVYASIIAIQQNDLKTLIAYSSIAHVGLIAAGVFALNLDGLQGALIQMLNHAIGAIGLFFAIDIIQQRTHTRQLNQLGGIAKINPTFAVFFMIIVLGTVAVPLTNGFVGELLLLKAIYQYNIYAAAIAGLTVIFCAIYMLRMYGLAMFGNTNATTQTFGNTLRTNEIAVLGIITLLIITIGIYPQPFFELTNASITKILESVRIP